MSDNEWDYECITCGHRITVPFDQFRPPTKCEVCEDTFCFFSKEIIEDNILTSALEERQWPKDD